MPLSDGVLNDAERSRACLLFTSCILPSVYSLPLWQLAHCVCADAKICAPRSTFGSFSVFALGGESVEMYVLSASSSMLFRPPLPLSRSKVMPMCSLSSVSPPVHEYGAVFARR